MRRMDLRKAADDAGVLGTQIAERFGVNPATVSRWLSGEVPVPSKHIRELSNILRVKPERVLALIEKRARMRR